MAKAKHVKDFRPARVNANKHTARGMSELQKSIQQDGWIGAMTTAADGEMIAGSARIETVAQVFGVDAEPIIVESDGTRPVVVVRKDIPTADDKRAQRLALADNRIHALDLNFDVEVISSYDADVIGELWTPAELSDLGQAWANEQEAAQNVAQQQVVEHKSLSERFIVPPFSVLDARQGYWQERKRAWLSLGIQSELGRGECITWTGDALTEPGLNHYRNRSTCVNDIDGEGLKIDAYRRLSGKRANATPGGAPRDAARLVNGKTVRGDGRGRQIRGGVRANVRARFDEGGES